MALYRQLNIGKVSFKELIIASNTIMHIILKNIGKLMGTRVIYRYKFLILCYDIRYGDLRFIFEHKKWNEKWEHQELTLRKWSKILI